MGRLFISVAFLFSFINFSCNRNSEKDSVKDHVVDQAFINSTELLKGGVIYSAKELQLSNILKGQGKSKVEVDSIISANQGRMIFEVRFRSLDEVDLLSKKFTGISYTDGVKYISSAISHDFYLINQNTDTLSCSGVLYERHYGVTPYKKVLVYFDGRKDIQYKDWVLLYEDHLFGNGIIEFKNQNVINL